MNGTHPVRFASRVLTAMSMVLGIVPTVGSAFELFDMTARQLEAYSLTVGTLVAALATLFGVQVTKRVTPTTNPRDDAGQPLTPGPIGSDGPDVSVVDRGI